MSEKKKFLEKLSLLKELNAQVEKLKELNAQAPTELNAKALIKLDLQVRAQIKLNAEALTKFFLYELLPFRLTQNAMFNNGNTSDKLQPTIKRDISSIAILATLLNEQKEEEKKAANLEQKKEPINIPTLLVFRESLKSLFNNVTNLDGANKALGELFTQYPLLNPENPSVFKALDEQKGRIFRNFKATTYDMFLSPLKEVTSLPTLLAKTLTSLMPGDNSPSMNAITPNTTNETQNNKQELIQTIKSWQKILHKTLGALSQAQQG